MILNQELFGSIVQEAVRSPRLRMLYDLRGSEDGDSQCMIISFCQEQSLPYCHIRSCWGIYGFTIEDFCDKQDK